VIPLRYEVPEDLVDHSRVDDEGDDPHLTAASCAHQRVDLLHPLDHLRPMPALFAAVAGLPEHYRRWRVAHPPADKGYREHQVIVGAFAPDAVGVV